MSNYSDDGSTGVLIIILRALSWFLAGYISWKLVIPESFGGALLFLLVWSIFGGILHFVALMLGVFLFGDRK